MDALRALPSVDALLRDARISGLIERHGRFAVTEAIRSVLSAIRAEITSHTGDANDAAVIDRIVIEVQERATASLRPVFNLTGTILHTNLGRAPLPAEAIEAIATAATGAFCYPHDQWNTDPASVDRAHERLWEVRDSQILRCWERGWSPQNFALFEREAWRRD